MKTKIFIIYDKLICFVSFYFKYYHDGLMLVIVCRNLLKLKQTK